MCRPRSYSPLPASLAAPGLGGQVGSMLTGFSNSSEHRSHIYSAAIRPPPSREPRYPRHSRSSPIQKSINRKVSFRFKVFIYFYSPINNHRCISIDTSPHPAPRSPHPAPRYFSSPVHIPIKKSCRISGTPSRSPKSQIRSPFSPACLHSPYIFCAASAAPPSR